MKKLAIAALMASFALTGCATQKLADEKVMVVEGQPVKVKVVNMPSFKVEIDPRKAVCDVVDNAGNTVQSECIQYRQLHQKNFTPMNGTIQGFTFEPGYRYVLDVRQEAIPNQATGAVESVWILNDVISKTAETTAAQ
ncbi:MAG: DUF4377 domain-containing protein [Psychrobacter sp.]|nr:DUF4377 domain-containing protein [Psychrobacter sp.]